MSHHVKVEITGNSSPAPEVFMLELFAPEIAAASRPGQFLHIRCGEGNDPLLRRPISIHSVNRRTGLVRVMFQVVGRGTALLAERQDGFLDVIGPLGSGFTLPGDCHGAGNFGSVKKGLFEKGPGKAGSILVVGGGIGAAPLFFLLQELASSDAAPRVKVLLGARSADRLLTMEQATALGFPVRVATDDGTAGLKGPVTYLLADELMRDVEFVYACGPAPMLKTACTLLEQAKVPGEVSLEERMACGVGACLSCVCKVREAGEKDNYKRACLEGPVFDAAEVVWE